MHPFVVVLQLFVIIVHFSEVILSVFSYPSVLFTRLTSSQYAITFGYILQYNIFFILPHFQPSSLKRLVMEPKAGLSHRNVEYLAECFKIKIPFPHSEFERVESFVQVDS